VSAAPFFAELQRRNVLRAGAFYAAAAWLLVQVATQVFPFFHIPEWVVRWIVVAAAIGFPFALAFAWFYEFTPQGLRRESEIAPAESITRTTGKKLDRWIIAILGVAVVLLLANTFVLHKDDAVAPGKSVAVLPLINESGDPQQDYFSDGLSEELISALGQVCDLKVIGRNSSFQFRGKQQDDNAGIGQKLGVSNLLEGTVRKLGDQVRIVASLINAADGTQLWSRTYDRELKDVFAVQSDIATAVVGAMKVTLFGKIAESGDKPPGGNLDAYNALLQGRFYAERRNRVDYVKAVDFYQQAIQLDPDYALAYARLAIAEQWFLDWALDNPAEREATQVLARTHAHKAVELNPHLAEAQGALGVTQAWSDLDIPAAETTLKEAVSLAPANAEILYQLADVTGSLGRLDESVALMRKALVLEPLNASYHFYLGQFLLTLGRLDEAEAQIQRAIDQQPTASGYHAYLTMLYVKRGHADQALAAAEAEQPGYNRRSSLALAYSMRGEQDKADAQLKQMVRLDADVSPTNLAEYYAYRGDADKAFVWLDHALQLRDPGVTSLYEDPIIFPALHNDPRFAALCRNVGLPVPAQVSATTVTRAASAPPTLQSAQGD
jgi:TolB-like protein/tetratricopeptide (TPR) repeat protein